MDAYTSFAQVYDDFMDNIPYEEWSDYLCKLLKEYNISNGLMLDLGCGTGSLTRLMSNKGFDMIGIDNSIDMLEIAKEKTSASNNILYLLQDMREFELYGTVNSVISICDSINYITSKEELIQVFKLVNNYLDPNGIFVFDINTLYKYTNILGENTIAEDREDISFIWDNYFDVNDSINEYSLSIFINESDNIYRKYQETHYQRAYSLNEIKECIEASGLKLLSIYDAFTKNPPNATSERLYVIAQENGK